MEEFARRHLGSSPTQISEMLSTLGEDTLEGFIKKVLPQSIYLDKALNLPEAMSESELTTHLKELAKENTLYRSFLGQGFYPCHIPPVIQRNIFENPAWYTAYTPYQAEISQGRLEALFNFQTLVTELCGLDLANASLLDEASALAEAVFMAYHSHRKNRDSLCFHPSLSPFNQEVIQLRTEPFSIKTIAVTDPQAITCDSFALILPYPLGSIEPAAFFELIDAAKEKGLTIIFVCDLLSLTLFKAPGELGADICVGNSQRLGVPMGFGGPSAAFLAAQKSFQRQLPGRVVGQTLDTHGSQAFRLAIQTREQHIRREKATSNVCTAQALLAVMASMYGVFHGPEGLKNIASKIFTQKQTLKKFLLEEKKDIENPFSFDSVYIKTSEKEKEAISHRAHEHGYNLHSTSCFVGASLDEMCTQEELNNLAYIFTGKKQDLSELFTQTSSEPEAFNRHSAFLTQPIFSAPKSETQMLRYIKHLEKKDVTLAQSMIPLGSCTMKLNSTSSLQALSWDAFAWMHPFAPMDQAKGYLKMIASLESYLCEITGFHTAHLQPNSGAQGELTALLVIRKYFQEKGQSQRHTILIPTSAHGTNPASAAMSGYRVEAVACNQEGEIDLVDLAQKLDKIGDQVAALMITYPSTHGVFEESVMEITRQVHQKGALVYLDGANLNAQVGLCKPAAMGADICHLNLHKTFGIPHGGGGPGVGPILASKELAPYFPNHLLNPRFSKGIGSPCHTPYGSASILLISYAYIRMLGATGLKAASQLAILNANYLMKQLEQDFPIPFRGKNGYVAHEFIMDLRHIKKDLDVGVEEIARRLMDFGYHAPTISWPLVGCMMSEPTESEDKAELDKFLDVLKQIKKELLAIENGQADKESNVLKNAPHTLADVRNWKYPYTIKEACFSLSYLEEEKYWPPVNAVNHAHGDRNLICSRCS